MIRRRREDSYLLVTQIDHARISGELAGHFGNARFARPSPLEFTLTAAGLHDMGWRDHDERPTLNAQGLPLDVFESPVSVTLPAWTASAEMAAHSGDYVALLVSLHVLGLSAFAATKPRTPAENFAINKFQHNQVERQEDLRRRQGFRNDVPRKLGLAVRRGESADEDALAYNHGVIQIVDRISLALCCEEVLFATIEGITSRPGGQPLTMTMARRGEEQLAVTPWPFDRERIDVRIPCRRVQVLPFARAEDLHRALASAPVEHIEMSAVEEL